MSKNIVIDPHLESYRTFFNHAWSRRMMELTEGTALDEIVFDLCVAWRGAANTHYFPWLMLQSMKSFAEGLAEAHEPFGKKWLSAVSSRLVAEMGDGLRPDQRHQLESALQRLDAQVRAALEKDNYDFDAQKFFTDLVRHSEVQFSLWGSQRICYGAVYYTYEDFLLRTYKAVTGQGSYQIRADDFSKDFATAFGPALRDFCWSHPAVHVARLTRHALVHNGGRVTDKLARQKHGLRVENGVIQIMAPDTKGLFDVLKERAEKLVIETVPRLGTVGKS